MLELVIVILLAIIIYNLTIVWYQLSKKRKTRPKSGKVLSSQIQVVSKPNLPALPRQTTTGLEKQTVFKKSQRTYSKKHLSNVKSSYLLLLQIRNRTAKCRKSMILPITLAMLRRSNPYVFEELVMSCCQQQGWQIKRNFTYTNDGGIDGRVIICGKLYVVQAKRYSGYINPVHVKDFQLAVLQDKAAGGFFMHCGRTGNKSKKLFSEAPNLYLFSGQKLVNFVLGKKVKTVKVTTSSSNN